MSTVRPLTHGEQTYAYGGPVTHFGAFFGATAGMIRHLSQMRIPSSAKWFPTRGANVSGMVLIGGGGLLGYYSSAWIFGKASLQRLDEQHSLDRAADAWAQKQEN